MTDIIGSLEGIPAGGRFIIILIAVLFVGLGTFGKLYVQLKSLSQTTDEAKVNAEKAAKMAEPTGNGFAKRTTDSLTLLTTTLREHVEASDDRMDKIETLLVGHIEAHANADLRRH